MLQSLSVDTVLPNGGASIHGLMDRWRMQACRDCTSGAFIMNRLVAYRALKGKHDRGIKAPLKIALRSRAFLDPIDWPAGRPPRQSTARQLYAHSTTRCPWPGPPSLLLANHTTLAAHLWLYVLALELNMGSAGRGGNELAMHGLQEINAFIRIVFVHLAFQPTIILLESNQHQHYFV